MSFKKIALAMLMVACLVAPAFAQRDTVSLNTIITKTGKFAFSYPIEKVYLHLDKPWSNPSKSNPIPNTDLPHMLP